MTDTTPTTPVQQKKKRNRLIDVLLILVMVGALAFGAWMYFNPSKLEVPDMTPSTANATQIEDMQNKPVTIDGANSGQAKNNGKKVDSHTGNDIKIPAMGDEDKGQEGELTDDQTTRSTSGDVITTALSQACPNIANGSICFPSRREVLYYHMVGTHWYNGVENMSIPSTYSVGLLNTTAPVGSDHGTSLFAAHVVFNGGRQGPFYTLPTTQVGEDVIIRDMQGRNWLYRVYKTAKVNRDQLPADLYDVNGIGQVAFVTCTGTYSAGHYQQRMLVYAVPVEVF